jgi:hypothetical protein
MMALYNPTYSGIGVGFPLATQLNGCTHAILFNAIYLSIYLSVCPILIPEMDLDKMMV